MACVYDFLRQPKWIAGHLLALTAVVLFASAGRWQYTRHVEVRERNELFAERLAEVPEPLADVLAEAGGDLDSVDYRRVAVTGAYRPDEELLLSVRSHRGEPGHHVLTPLVTAEGDGVLVDRGWVPYEYDEPPVAAAAPPVGEVTVEGVLFPTEADAGFAVNEADEGDLDYVARVDLARIAPQVSADLAPVWLLAQQQTPAAPGELPIPAELPVLDAGPHLNYVGQWSLFTLVVLIGYPFLLRRRARESAAERNAPQPRTPVSAGR